MICVHLSKIFLYIKLLDYRFRVLYLRKIIFRFMINNRIRKISRAKRPQMLVISFPFNSNSFERLNDCLTKTRLTAGISQSTAEKTIRELEVTTNFLSNLRERNLYHFHHDLINRSRRFGFLIRRDTSCPRKKSFLAEERKTLYDNLTLTQMSEKAHRKRGIMISD